MLNYTVAFTLLLPAFTVFGQSTCSVSNLDTSQAITVRHAVESDLPAVLQKTLTPYSCVVKNVSALPITGLRVFWRIANSRVPDPDGTGPAKFIRTDTAEMGYRVKPIQPGQEVVITPSRDINKILWSGNANKITRFRGGSRLADMQGAAARGQNPEVSVMVADPATFGTGFVTPDSRLSCPQNRQCPNIAFRALHHRDHLRLLLVHGG